jgi:glutathione S-transferase
MKLLYQTHSPYARKVLVFAHEAGLAGSIEVIHHETSPTLRNETVFAQNPLGKVPVLLRGDQSPIFDSDVICAYLDTLHIGPKLIPPEGPARWAALTMQSTAQGMADAGIAIRWETTRRPEGLRYPPLAQGYSEKLAASYTWLENAIEKEASLHIGHVAVATVLSWLQFRELPSFRDRPRLSTWFDSFENRASMRATPLSGNTVDAIAS